jgi:molybdate transport system substrate-binding protein
MATFTLKSALDVVIQAYKADGADVTPLYGMTPMLAKQVENLAPSDIFLSADADWMNDLQDHDLIRNDTRVNLLTADPVLATRSDNAAAPTYAPLGRDFPL